MPKGTNGVTWSRTSSALSRHSAASQLATKKPMPALPASSISSRLPPRSGDCKRSLIQICASGARTVRSQRRRPEGARGRRQRIVRNLEATTAQAGTKIGVKRQSKGPQSYAYRSLNSPESKSSEVFTPPSNSSRPTSKPSSACTTQIRSPSNGQVWGPDFGFRQNASATKPMGLYVVNFRST